MEIDGQGSEAVCNEFLRICLWMPIRAIRLLVIIEIGVIAGFEQLSTFHHFSSIASFSQVAASDAA